MKRLPRANMRRYIPIDTFFAAARNFNADGKAQEILTKIKPPQGLVRTPMWDVIAR